MRVSERREWSGWSDPRGGCTDQEKTLYCGNFNRDWSAGPTQIRYCGLVERKKRRPSQSIILQYGILVGPADHGRLAPPQSFGLLWSVQPTGGSDHTDHSGNQTIQGVVA